MTIQANTPNEYRPGTRLRATISFVVLPGGEVSLVILTAMMLGLAGFVAVLAIVRGDPVVPVLSLLAIALYGAYVFDYIRRRERQARAAGRDRYDVEVAGLAAIPPLLALLVIAVPLGTVDTYFALLRKIRPARAKQHSEPGANGTPEPGSSTATSKEERTP